MINPDNICKDDWVEFIGYVSGRKVDSAYPLGAIYQVLDVQVPTYGGCLRENIAVIITDKLPFIGDDGKTIKGIGATAFRKLPEPEADTKAKTTLEIPGVTPKRVTA